MNEEMKNAAVSGEWKLVPVEPTEEMIYWIATGAHRGDSGKEIWSEALAYAPVPTAGDVEVLGWMTNGPDPVFPGKVIHHLWDTKEQAENHLKDIDFAAGWKVSELVDRAHVARLQAEIDTINNDFINACNYASDIEKERDALKAEVSYLTGTLKQIASDNVDLQSELTKARELLNQQEGFIESAWQWLPLWLRKTYRRIDRQPAPAAKCETCDGTGHDLDGGMNPNGGAADCLDCGGRGAAAKGEGDE